MSKHECYALAAGIGIAALGLALSVINHTGACFARSGAAVVVVAIVFGALQLRERVRKAPAFVEEQLQKNHPDYVSQGTRRGLDQKASEELVAQIEGEVRNDVNKQVENASKRLLLVEVMLLIAGTIIWGFGDIPVDAMVKNSSSNPSHAKCADAACGSRENGAR
jgi:hypothetical protein